MKRLIRMEIDGLPPTVNHSYEKRGCRLYKSSECRRYQDEVKKQLIKEWGNRKPYTGPVELRIIFQTTDRRRWDIDNRVKALQDCLGQAGIIQDDSQIKVLHVERENGDHIATLIEVKPNDKSKRISRGNKELGNKV